MHEGSWGDLSQPGIGRGVTHSTMVQCTNGLGIVVERPMYFTYTGSMGSVNGGHNGTGHSW